MNNYSLLPYPTYTKEITMTKISLITSLRIRLIMACSMDHCTKKWNTVFTRDFNKDNRQIYKVSFSMKTDTGPLIGETFGLEHLREICNVRKVRNNGFSGIKATVKAQIFKMKSISIPEQYSKALDNKLMVVSFS